MISQDRIAQIVAHALDQNEGAIKVLKVLGGHLILVEEALTLKDYEQIQEGLEEMEEFIETGGEGCLINLERVA